jgi:uncharacterized protein
MVDVAQADVVAVLTRAPSAGGKSRLFAALGIAPDEALLAALLLDTIDGASSPEVKTVAVVTPASACGEVAALAHVAVMPQPPGTLGERMRDTMARLFTAGARRVALIGSDLPTITRSSIAGAFLALDKDAGAVVLGPAVDGGYYLIAAAHVPPVFDGIAWGTATVFDETRARAAAAGCRVHTLDELQDVDTAESLRAACERAPDSRTAAWALRR